MTEQVNNRGALGDNSLSLVVVSLLKGVIYQTEDSTRWNALLNLQARARDYVSVLGLELVIDEAEGYAFLRSVADPENGLADGVPRLVARRPLSYPVSLLLALLRKRMAEFDAGGVETRLVLTRDEIVEMVRVFLAETSNEAKLTDQIDMQLNKIADLGFLKKLRPVSGPASKGSPEFEVRRILKAFVDAQWLAEFDTRLREYRTQSSLKSDESENA